MKKSCLSHWLTVVKKVQAVPDAYPEDWEGEPPTVAYENDDKSKQSEKKGKRTVYIVIGAVAVSAAALATVLCVKRKNKNK